MFDRFPDSPYRVPSDGRFRLADLSTDPPKGAPDEDRCEKELAAILPELSELQRRFYAHDRHSLLLVFQALDAAGKDGTIRAVMNGVDPAGCQVFSFKQPSPNELEHDFLWRTACRLPERGRIGIFNRSYYEEVLVVRVHPEFLDAQRLPEPVDPETLWEDRFESIRDHEKHLARNGTLVLKFFLNVSKGKQRKRFLARIDEPEKNWKFSIGDVKERRHWDAYQHAYEEALGATSRPWAPWYAVPADEKSFLRLTVARVVVETLRVLQPSYPTLAAEDRARMQEMRSLLESEDDGRK